MRKTQAMHAKDVETPSRLDRASRGARDLCTKDALEMPAMVDSLLGSKP